MIIFGPKRTEVSEKWRKLHHEELNDLYSSPIIARLMKSTRMRRAGNVARRVESRSVYRVLVGKPDGKRPLERPRRRWEDNIKMDLQEVGCEGMDWIELAQDWDRWRALVNAGNFLTDSEPVSFSRRTVLHAFNQYNTEAARNKQDKKAIPKTPHVIRFNYSDNVHQLAFVQRRCYKTCAI